MKCLPSLFPIPKRFKGNMGGMSGEANLTSSLRDLYKSMGETSESFPPFALLTVSAGCNWW